MCFCVGDQLSTGWSPTFEPGERDTCVIALKNRSNGESHRQRPFGDYDGVGGQHTRAIVSPLRHAGMRATPPPWAAGGHYTPQVAMRQSTRQNHPENPTVRRKMCLHTYFDASFVTQACFWSQKRQIFFLGDLLENRVDTTYIHKEWNKIVTLVLCEWKKKNESLLRPNPRYT